MRRVVVTGGASGLGAALTAAFRARGDRAAYDQMMRAQAAKLEERS